MTVALTVCVAAVLLGGREEKLAALAFLISWAATLLLRDRSWVGMQWGGLFADLGLFLAFFGIALRSSRYWPIWAAGFQLLAVVTHGARLIDPNLGAWAYITAGVIWTWLVMAAMAVGVYECWRERRDPAASSRHRYSSFRPPST